MSTINNGNEFNVGLFMKIKELFESPQEDYAFRSSAREKLKLVFDEVNDNGYRNFKYHKGMNAYYKSFGNFSVVFAEGEEGDGGFAKGSNQIWLYINNLMRPLASLKTHKVQTAFIHEAIHLSDSARFGVFNPPPDPDVYGMKAYQNDPSELNAHYQEALHLLDVMIVRHPNIKQKWSNPHTFMSNAQILFKKGFLESLDERNRRAILKRLYKHFDELVRT